jgi:hypothetical protein
VVASGRKPILGGKPIKSASGSKVSTPTARSRFQSACRFRRSAIVMERSCHTRAAFFHRSVPEDNRSDTNAPSSLNCDLQCLLHRRVRDIAGKNVLPKIDISPAIPCVQIVFSCRFFGACLIVACIEVSMLSVGPLCFALFDQFGHRGCRSSCQEKASPRGLVLNERLPGGKKPDFRHS